MSKAPVATSASDLLKEISPTELLLIYDLAQRKAAVARTPSPLSNKYNLEKELSKIRAGGYRPDVKIVCDIIDKNLFEILDKKISNLDEYKIGVEGFISYIRLRWNAVGEDDNTRTKLTASLCRFFLECHNLDSEILVAQFPPQPGDFNCFDGITERIDELRKSEGLLLQDLSSAYQSARLEAFQPIKSTTPTTMEVHAYDYFGKILDVEFANSRMLYDISSPILAAELNRFAQRFFARVEKIFLSAEENVLTEILFLGKEIMEKDFTPQDAEKLKQLFEEAGWRMSEQNEEDFTLKAAFEKKLIQAIEKKFSLTGLAGYRAVIDDEDLFIADESETDSEEYLLKLNSRTVAAITNAINNAHLAELHELRRSPEISGFRSTAVVRELDVVTCYSRQSTARIVAQLSSANPDEMLQALNVIFALSKPGYGSLALHVFNPAIAEAAGNLEKFFQKQISQKPPQLFYQKHHPKLLEYLGRLKIAEKTFRKTSAAHILAGKKIDKNFAPQSPTAIYYSSYATPPLKMRWR